jgi:hypothetical protein
VRHGLGRASRQSCPGTDTRLMLHRPWAGGNSRCLHVVSIIVVINNLSLPRRCVSSGCEVIVSYDVSLGQGTGLSSGSAPYYYTDVPIFFGQVGIYSSNVGLPPNPSSTVLATVIRRNRSVKLSRQGFTLMSSFTLTFKVYPFFCDTSFGIRVVVLGDRLLSSRGLYGGISVPVKL